MNAQNDARRSVPPTTRHDDVAEMLHSRLITDPFRWLEDADSPATKAWIAAQTEYSRAVLDALPGRERISDELSHLLAIGDLSLPIPRRGRFFFERRQGLQNQPVLYLRDLHGQDRPLIDPNSLNSAGTTSLDWWYPSIDGHLLAYGLSEGGDELSTLYVLDVDAGTNLPDSIAYTRAASVAWRPDNSGFYYTGYPAPGEVPTGEEVYHRRVFYHQLGQDPKQDAPVFGEGRDPTDWPSVSLSPDGRYLFISVNRGWDKSDCYIRDETGEDRAFRAVIEDEPALSSGQVVGKTLYLLTNLDAPRFRLFAVAAHRPARENWTPLVDEDERAVLEDVHIGNGRMLLAYTDRAISRLELRSINGDKLVDLPTPGIGTVAGISGESDSDEAYFAFTSFVTPTLIQRCMLSSGEESIWDRVDAPPARVAIEVEQVFYLSKDGTSISMFVVSREGLPRDRSNPAVLSGYGGFNISMTPAYSRTLSFWLERGGIYAVPNLRGGGEYGEAWHAAGMLQSKQNVFDDFIAAADYLCASGFTSPERLACSGGSNGGLLVGAAITQRPDLFRAAVCAVPLLDMLRYERFQIARLWVAEYGSAEDPRQFEWLYAYSPYHHVAEAAEYPAVLFLSGASDTRVDPMHARKMTALLQESTISDRPVLLRVESHAGHGAGRPLDKTLAEQVDVWSFLCWQLELKPE
jgi:prolyl oligopeptidase